MRISLKKVMACALTALLMAFVIEELIIQFTDNLMYATNGGGW